MVHEHEYPFPFPLKTGVYDTSPKMARLYTNDGHLSDGMPEFVFDRNYEHYIASKLQNLSNNPERYRVLSPIKSHEHAQVAQETIRLFATKCPLACRITDGTAYFLETGLGIHVATGEILAATHAHERARRIQNFLQNIPMPLRLFDALALHIQEDFAITVREQQCAFPQDFLELAHISFPSHWDPRQKVGRNFGDIHRPVANNERLIKAHQTLINSMVERGPFTRFVWGIAFSDDLDRHPEHVHELCEEKPKTMEQLVERTFLRVERQVTHPMASINRSFFTIRVFIKPVRLVAHNLEHRSLLRDALMSMNDEAIAYKGLSDHHEKLVWWLTNFDDYSF